jgi:hypothetical protein
MGLTRKHARTKAILDVNQMKMCSERYPARIRSVQIQRALIQSKTFVYKSAIIIIILGK